MLKLNDQQVKASQEAALLLYSCRIAYIVGEMRTGKTLTAMTAAQLHGAKNVLFLTKLKAISSIQKDYRLGEHGEFTFAIRVLNYEKLAAYFESGGGAKYIFKRQQFYDDYLEPDLVVIDEAHGLGQYPKPAEKVKYIKEICSYGGVPIIFLSGTPTPESYSQLYHQLYVSAYSPFKEFADFYRWASGATPSEQKKGLTYKGFVNVKKKKVGVDQEVNDYSDADKALIDDHCRHLFITMTQKDAGFVSEVTDDIVQIDAAPATYHMMKKLIKDRVVKMNDGSLIMGDTAVKLQQKVHQICSGTIILEPKMVPTGTYEWSEAEGKNVEIFKAERVSRVFDSSKAMYIRSIHEYDKSARIAIVYIFQEEYMAILTTFGYDRLTEDPEEFASTDKIFVGQIRSIREGVNLSCADYLFMYNIEFSALSYMQGRQRMQSMSRPNAVCHWLFIKGGIEHKIYEKVVNKLDYTSEYFKKDFVDAKEEK